MKAAQNLHLYQSFNQTFQSFSDTSEISEKLNFAPILCPKFKFVEIVLVSF